MHEASNYLSSFLFGSPRSARVQCVRAYDSRTDAAVQLPRPLGTHRVNACGALRRGARFSRYTRAQAARARTGGAEQTAPRVEGAASPTSQDVVTVGQQWKWLGSEMIAIAPQPGGGREFSGTLPGVDRLPACRDCSPIIAVSLSGKLLSKRSFRHLPPSRPSLGSSNVLRDLCLISRVQIDQFALCDVSLQLFVARSFAVFGNDRLWKWSIFGNGNFVDL